MATKPDQPRVSSATVAAVRDTDAPPVRPRCAPDTLPWGWPHGFDIVFVQQMVRTGAKRGVQSMKMAIGLMVLLVLASCGVPIVPLI